ncbi:MAG: DNA cytosine methyltransferase, partial [Alistipes sp.]|nr:DNA cytosine methyltransferase [Alistipes sp.]
MITNNTYKAVELFAGIGGFRLACNNLNIETIWANDIDPTAIKVY